MAPSVASTNKHVGPRRLDTASAPPFYKRKNGILLYFLLSASALSSFASGFDGVSSSYALQSPPGIADLTYTAVCSPYKSASLTFATFSSP